MRYSVAEGHTHLAHEASALTRAGFVYACSYRVHVDEPPLDLHRELWTHPDGTAVQLGHSGFDGRESNVVTVFADGDILRTIGLGDSDATRLPARLGDRGAGLHDELCPGKGVGEVIEHHRARVVSVRGGRAPWPVRTFDDVRRLGARTSAILDNVGSVIGGAVFRVLVGVTASAIAACVGAWAWKGWAAAGLACASVAGVGWLLLQGVVSRRIPLRATLRKVPPAEWPAPPSPFMEALRTARPYLSGRAPGA